jgi:hypothetical protein
MKTQMDLRDAAMDEYSKEQHTISRQVLANGAAISKMTLKQMDEAAAEDNKPHFDQDPTFDTVEVDSLIFPKQEPFHNIFVDPKHEDRTKPSRSLRTDYGYTAHQDHQDKAKHITHPLRGRDRAERPSIYPQTCYAKDGVS